MASTVPGSADWRRTENRFLASLMVQSYAASSRGEAPLSCGPGQAVVVQRYLVTNRKRTSAACRHLLPSCCQHDQVIMGHETRRPTFSDHSDPAANGQADN